MGRKSRYKRLKMAVLTACIGLIVMMITCWMLFQHIPDWYRPAHVPAEHLDAVRADLARSYDRLSQLMNTAEAPFTYSWTQDQINAWLSVPEEIVGHARGWLPQGFSDPAVAIEADGLRLAVRYDLGGVNTILNVRFTIQLLPDRIILRLVEVASGSLPLPKNRVLKELAGQDDSWWPAGEVIPHQIGDMRYPPLTDLAEGMELPVLWIWQNGKRPFKIIDLQLRPGVIIFRIEPLPR